MKIIILYLKRAWILNKKFIVKFFNNGFFVKTQQSMNALELMLPSEEFVRVHRSFIVAVKKIASYTASTLEVQGITIPIGRNFKGNVTEAL